ncbi:DUF4160 domain-containing protein [Almyronema epifaneia]|uniref:DUF4160 domain-containing protein n=1 Tax=Almyronema epifaneia S1 TaxID=2991925 RepID=A0ABW6IDM3_9CYAN
MPTVLRKDGFAFRIYPNDHKPAHVHVIKGGGEVKINLWGSSSNQESPTIVKIWNMSDKDVVKAYELVTIYRGTLIRSWKEIHD